jgi:hypothetical protein
MQRTTEVVAEAVAIVAVFVVVKPALEQTISPIEAMVNN